MKLVEYSVLTFLVFKVLCTLLNDENTLLNGVYRLQSRLHDEDIIYLVYIGLPGRDQNTITHNGPIMQQKGMNESITSKIDLQYTIAVSQRWFFWLLGMSDFKCSGLGLLCCSNKE